MAHATPLFPKAFDAVPALPSASQMGARFLYINLFGVTGLEVALVEEQMSNQCTYVAEPLSRSFPRFFMNTSAWRRTIPILNILIKESEEGGEGTGKGWVGDFGRTSNRLGEWKGGRRVFFTYRIYIPPNPPWIPPFQLSGSHVHFSILTKRAKAQMSPPPSLFYSFLNHEKQNLEFLPPYLSPPPVEKKNPQIPTEDMGYPTPSNPSPQKDFPHAPVDSCIL